MADAASELGTAVSLDPEMSFAYSALGSLKLDQNSLAEATENFKRAIALNSGNATAHYGLGATLLKQDTDNAIKELNTSLYQFPNSWPVENGPGRCVSIARQYRRRLTTVSVVYFDQAGKFRTISQNGRHPSTARRLRVGYRGFALRADAITLRRELAAAHSGHQSSAGTT